MQLVLGLQNLKLDGHFYFVAAAVFGLDFQDVVAVAISARAKWMANSAVWASTFSMYSSSSASPILL